MQYYNPNSLKKAAPMNVGGFNRLGQLTNEQLIGADAGTIARNATAQRAKMLQDYSLQDNPALKESFGGLYNYANQASNNLAELESGNKSAIDTATQRGLANLLSQHAKANAGTGRLGSRQYAGAQGDMFSRVGEAQANAFLAERNAGAQRANSLSNLLMNTQQAEDYRPRYIMDQLGNLGNESVRNYLATQPQAQAEEASLIETLLPTALTVGGALSPLGPLAGGMAGNALGNAIVGDGKGGAGGQSQLATLLSLAAMQNGDRRTGLETQQAPQTPSSLGYSPERPYSSSQYLSTSRPEDFYNPNYSMSFKGSGW